MKVGILGGGITGLALGHFLKKRGIDFEILEKEKECGGLCRSVSENGFTFDYGGHVIWSRDEEILKFMLSFVSDNVLEHKRNVKIFYNDNFIKYPFENGVTDLPVNERLEILLEFVDALGKDEKEIKNFEDWVYCTFGKGIADKYLIPYNKKIWKTHPSSIALDWIKIKDRLPKPKKEDIIKSALGVESEGFTQQSTIYYPEKGGFCALANSMCDSIKDNVVTDFEISKILKKGKWQISDGKSKKEYDKIISTMPVTDLIKKMDNVPKDVLKAVEDLKFNSLVVVALGIKSGKYPEYHWAYFPDMNFKSHKISFLKNSSPYTSPKGKSLLMADITCKLGDEIWKMEDDALAKEIMEWLDKKGIIDKKAVVFKKVVRSKYAYVINDTNYQKNIKTIMKFLKRKGITPCGRFSEFKYLNADACIRSAKEVAEKF